MGNTIENLFFSTVSGTNNPVAEIVKVLYFISRWACATPPSPTPPPTAPPPHSPWATLFVDLSGLAATFAVLFVARRILYSSLSLRVCVWCDFHAQRWMC